MDENHRMQYINIIINYEIKHLSNASFIETPKTVTYPYHYSEYWL